MTTIADLIIRRLREAGVNAIFGVPGGGSNLDLIAAATRARMPFVLTSTETAAAIAAIAQAEITGRPGVCLTTLGPGAASAVNGIACAWLDRAPVLIFTDSHPSSARDCIHQRLDHQALFAPVAKWSASLTAERADETVREALVRAMTPPYGPVHLDCPGDVLSVAVGPGPVVSDALGTSSATTPGAESTEPATDWWTRAAPLLSRSHRPQLLVGLGARRAEDAAAVRSFCERRGVPALVTYKAKGVVPDDHAWFAGVVTNAAIERPMIGEADLLIGIGLDPVELIPRPWIAAAPIVNIGPFAAAAAHVPFAAQRVGEIAAGLREIEPQLPTCEWNCDRIRATRDERRAQISSPGGEFTAQRVVDVAARRLAPVARVTVDAGAHMFPATMLWPVSEPNGMLISNGLSTMGFALPAAIGAALTDRERPVVALTGDGGLLMCMAELSTAVRERLPIIVIVFADEALSLIQIKQHQRALDAAGVALGRVAWASLAESFGAAGFTASDEAQLDRAVEEALAVRGPSLIAARIDPSTYGRTLRAIRG